MICYALYRAPDNIAGGIRAIYHHVELLNELGFEACVYCPGGRSTWFDSPAPVVTSLPALAAADHVVLPEGVGAPEEEALASPAVKHVFCQNQFYVFRKHRAIAERARLGITHVFASTGIIAQYLETTFAGLRAPVVPYVIDRERFQPGVKEARIAYMPRKLADDALFIEGSFKARYPGLAGIPWVRLDGLSQDRVAEELGRSAVFLSLGHRESFGLPPVEAMAAGCVVVGFHGGGGLEYATPANGLWYHHDQAEAVADGLAVALRAFQDDAPLLHGLRQRGAELAGRYGRAACRDALERYFTACGAPRREPPAAARGGLLRRLLTSS